jgi:hypothetical protein
MRRFVQVLVAILLFPFRLARFITGLAIVGLIAYSWLSYSPQIVEASETPVEEIAPENRIAVRSIGWYHPTVEFTDADPELSACGPTLDRQVAVSRDLLSTDLPCGTRVRVDLENIGTIGIFTVWDTMGASRKNEANVMIPIGESAWWSNERAWLTIVD